MSSSILIIGHVWPEPNSSAAGTRMLQLLHFFATHQWDITFACTAQQSEHATALTPYGIRSKSITLNDPSFDDFIQELAPEFVLFDRFMTEEQFGWRVSKHCPNAIRILNTEDLHCLRKSRHYCIKKNIPFTYSVLNTQEITQREIASMYRCDLTLIISEFEMQLLQQHFQISKDLLCYLPFLFPPVLTEELAQLPSFEARSHFITIGNFRHDPNWDSYRYVKEKIWPLIRQQLPEAELHIYGAYPPPKAAQLHAPNEGLYIKGWANDAAYVMQHARVCLAPLRFGAGLKGKLVEAMRYGTPSVTTTIGAEGMHGKDDWNGSVQDDPIAFAQAAVSLYQNRTQWLAAQQQGFHLFETRFLQDLFQPKFLNTLQTLQQQLKSHRSQNFIGTMLQYHTLRSTEFMSRWIEEKNK